MLIQALATSSTNEHLAIVTHYASAGSLCDLDLHGTCTNLNFIISEQPLIGMQKF